MVNCYKIENLSDFDILVEYIDTSIGKPSIVTMPVLSEHYLNVCSETEPFVITESAIYNVTINGECIDNTCLYYNTITTTIQNNQSCHTLILVTGVTYYEVYSYDVTLNQTSYLFTTNVTHRTNTDDSPAIAHAGNKIWILDPTYYQLYEYNVTSWNTFSIGSNIIYNLGSFRASPMLTAISNTELITICNSTNCRGYVFKINLFWGFPSLSPLFGTPISWPHGDIIKTFNDMLIVTYHNTSGDRKIEQYNFNLHTRLMTINFPNSLPGGLCLNSLFVENGILYIINGYTNYVYTVDRLYPYNITQVSTVTNIGRIVDCSREPGCEIFEFAINDTPTTTTTTPPSTICNCYYVSNLSSKQSITVTYNTCKIGTTSTFTIGAGVYPNFKYICSANMPRTNSPAITNIVNTGNCNFNYQNNSYQCVTTSTTLNGV